MVSSATPPGSSPAGSWVALTQALRQLSWHNWIPPALRRSWRRIQGLKDWSIRVSEYLSICLFAQVVGLLDKLIKIASDLQSPSPIPTPPSAANFWSNAKTKKGKLGKAWEENEGKTATHDGQNQINLNASQDPRKNTRSWAEAGQDST